jgi:hypothetical protein
MLRFGHLESLYPQGFERVVYGGTAPLYSRAPSKRNFLVAGSGRRTWSTLPANFTDCGLRAKLARSWIIENGMSVILSPPK